MAKSWVARRYRYNRENERLLAIENEMFNSEGRYLFPSEIERMQLPPVITPEIAKLIGEGEYAVGRPIPYKTGWGGRAHAPLSYQSEVADDRVRNAKRLAGMKHHQRSNFDDFFNGCFITLGVGLVAGIAGGFSGYIISKDHPFFMATGGVAVGFVGATYLAYKSWMLTCKIKDLIYERAIERHKTKRKNRL